MTTYEFKNFDYSEGEKMMQELYQVTQVETRTFIDFLNLPKVEGYENNPNRANVDFSGCVDVSQNITEPMILPPPVLRDASGNIVEIEYIDISNNNPYEFSG